MGVESRLLYDERPLVLIPELARLLKGQPGFSGIDEALVLQQVHYWVILNQRANRNEQGGYFWTYNTFKAWAEQFAFLWSESTLKRIFARLEKRALLISGRFNKSNIDRTKWYRVNYEELDRLCQSDPSIVSEWSNARGQVDTMQGVKLTPSGQAQVTKEIPLPENNQRITTKSNDREAVLPSSSKSPRIPNLNIPRIFEFMQSYFGYPSETKIDPIPNHGKEAKAISRMLKRGFTEDQIRDAWKFKVAARGEFVSMVWVNEDIGKRNRTEGEQTKLFPTSDPDKFIKGKLGHMVKR